MQTIIKPPALQKGDCIGIISPSSYFPEDTYRDAASWLEKFGFKIKIHPQVQKRHGQLAGTEEERVDALHDYFTDPEIKAIFCTVGGNGSVHLLDKIDYSLIKNNPKIFMGLSDITALLNSITAKTGLITFHGPVLKNFLKIKDQWISATLALLMGEPSDDPFIEHLETVRPGAAEGQIFGGNLSVLQALIGTPYAPDMKDALLFIEDINDHTSRYDRMLGHMRQAGWLDHLSGLMIGEFINSLDNPERPFGFTIEERAEHLTKGKSFPICTNLPVGHGDNLCPLPIGIRARLDGTSLRLLESPVS